MIAAEVNKAIDFSTRKVGDTPTDANQLTPKAYVDAAVSSLLALSVVTTKGDLIVGSIAGGVARLGVGTDTFVLTSDSTKPLGIAWEVIPSVAGTTVAVYGDGSDGVITLNGSTNYAAASIISTNTYLQTRDIYATVFTANNATSLRPSQYRIFASSVATINGASVVTKGNNATANVGGTSILAGYFPSVAAGADGGSAGAGGNNGAGQPGGAGVTGTSLIHSIGGNGVVSRSGTSTQGGAANANQGGIGGAAGGAGTASVSSIRPIAIWGAQYMLDVDSNGATAKLTGSAGSASGPGGGGGGSGSGTQLGGNGGAGGAAGSNGGFIAIYSPVIQLTAGSTIDVRGGNGGVGGNGITPTVTSASQGGGGAGANGGSGASGGYVILAYNTLVNSGSILTAAGTGGVGGTGAAGVNGGGTGGNGVAGFDGNPGSVLTFQIMK